MMFLMAVAALSSPPGQPRTGFKTPGFIPYAPHALEAVLQPLPGETACDGADILEAGGKLFGRGRLFMFPLSQSDAL
jgi:hypothetical protein